MSRVACLMRRLASSRDGTALIETAVLAPVIIMMAVGTFEASAMVARQSELQSTAEQATEIALAVVPDTADELAELKSILMESSGLSPHLIDIRLKYRCGSETTLSETLPSCSEESLNTYVS